jgi:hypothetical protein
MCEQAMFRPKLCNGIQKHKICCAFVLIPIHFNNQNATHLSHSFKSHPRKNKETEGNGCGGIWSSISPSGKTTTTNQTYDGTENSKQTHPQHQS